MLKRQRVPHTKRRPIEEDIEEPGPGHIRVEPLPATPLWALLLIAAVPLVAVVLCGSRSAWAIGLTTVFMGGVVLAVPPRCRLPLPLAISLGLMLLLPLGAFLPMAEGVLPEWRRMLQESYALELPSTRSPQPWLSLQGWLLLAVGTCWLAACLTRGFDEPQRRRLLHFLSLGIAVIAVISLVLHYRGLEFLLWTGEHRLPYFGPFTNRNNFTGLLAPGAVLAFACAYDAYHRRTWSWPVFALALLPIFAAILTNTSRMGVVLFFAGLGAWMISGSQATRSAKRFAVFTSLLLVLATVFLIFGRRIVERFTGTEGVISTLTADGRIQIYQRSLQLIHEAPLLGTGLGNFEPVYALHKGATMSNFPTRTLHPESDWLWFGIEGGLLALAAAGAAGFFVWKNFGRWKRADGSGRRDRRLRAAAGIGVALLVIQGFFDTPLHTLGLAMLGALLAGLASHPARRAPAPDAAGILRYSASGFCLLCGLLWLAIGGGAYLMPGGFSARQLTAQAKSLAARGDYADALLSLNRAIAIRPLQWDAYFMRASLNLHLGRPHQVVMDDFARARALEPNHAGFCMDEARVWLDHDPELALPALREAMRRDPRNAGDYYRQAVDTLHRHPALHDPLRAMADDPKLLLIYLERVSGTYFQTGLRELLNRHPSLEHFTQAQKVSLFEIWYARGDQPQLIRELGQNPSWRTAGWIILGRHLASQGKFREACDLGFQHMRAPSLPETPSGQDLGQLTRAFLQNPSDPFRGLALYRVQRKLGMSTEAFSTLREVARLPNSPPSAIYEAAVRLAERGDYSRAWDALLLYHRRTNT